MDKLQKEAFDFAGLTTPAPSTGLKLMVSELSASQRGVLDLNPGEVSHVVAENNGYFIYKSVGKEQKRLDDKLREDIKSKLAHQRFQSTMDQLHKSFVTTVSVACFGTEPAQAGPAHGMPIPRPTPPGAVAPAVSSGATAAPASSGAPVVSPAAAKMQVPEATTAKPAASQPAEPPR